MQAKDSNLTIENLGIVVIGRNEGDRLLHCLDTLQQQLAPGTSIVYVDSGSVDGSFEAAKQRGFTTIVLEPSSPFTAARARNAGWQWLIEQHPHLEYIQFLDGDCELVTSWLPQAIQAIGASEHIAIVCGRRLERFPNASPYNRLADMEWNTAIGNTKACGGDALIRTAALKAVDGYNPQLICGEEPEMCIRLRRQGWIVLRIDAEMTLHDAAMIRFSQWWKRSRRTGWAVAEGFALYGHTSESYMKRQHASGWLWGLILPLVVVAGLWPSHGLTLLLCVGYILLGWRIYCNRQQNHHDLPEHARLYAYFCTLSKVPQMLGQVQYWLSCYQRRVPTLIEYKTIKDMKTSP